MDYRYTWVGYVSRGNWIISGEKRRFGENRNMDGSRNATSKDISRSDSIWLRGKGKVDNCNG